MEFYKKYLFLCPKARPTPFYLRPLTKAKQTEYGEVWYGHQAVGQTYLADIVSKICHNTGLTGYQNNHSLRTSAASLLYQKGVEEQLIQEQTGHRLNAVRGYRRSTDAMKRKISDIISGDNGEPSVSVSKCVKLDNPTSASAAPELSLSLNINIQVLSTKLLSQRCPCLY